MIEIASQIVVCLILAASIGFLIGFILGKFLVKDGRCIHNFSIKYHAGAQSNVYNKPLITSIPRPRGKDDLKKIEGIDKNTELKLNSLGIYHFDQIAKWSEKNCLWVENYLELEKNHIAQARWKEQAKNLCSQQ